MTSLILSAITTIASNSSSSGPSFLSLIIGIFEIAITWIVFTKAGEPGWAAIIPIYNCIVLFRIVYGSGVKCLLMLVPILNIVVAIGVCYRLPQVFGMEKLFCILDIFFSPVVMAIIAFSNSARYTGHIESFI